jgi:hypothetical protein
MIEEFAIGSRGKLSASVMERLEMPTLTESHSSLYDIGVSGTETASVV